MMPAACGRNDGGWLKVSSSGDSSDRVSASIPCDPVVSLLTVRDNALPASGPSSHFHPNGDGHIGASPVDVISNSTSGGCASVKDGDIVSSSAGEACGIAEQSLCKGGRAVDCAIIGSDTSRSSIAASGV